MKFLLVLLLTNLLAGCQDFKDKLEGKPPEAYRKQVEMHGWYATACINGVLYYRIISIGGGIAPAFGKDSKVILCSGVDVR